LLNLQGVKTNKAGTRPTVSKPEKVLLHMARTGDDWAGVAIRFDGKEPYRFRNLALLVGWLSRLRGRE
jgi:hypothetical protein